MVLDNKSLWPWVLAPTLLTAVAAVGGAWGAWAWAKGWIDRHLAGHGAFVAALLAIILFIFVAGVFYVGFVAVAKIATAPFAGFISEKTEAIQNGKAIAPEGLWANLRESARGLAHTLMALAIYVAISVVLLILHWVATIFAPIVWVLGVSTTALFVSYDAFDLVLSRRGKKFGEKWKFLGDHTAESLGFGSMIALVLLVPGLGLLVPAIAAVGGTLLALEIERQPQ
jgi:CysZ protein